MRTKPDLFPSVLMRQKAWDRVRQVRRMQAVGMTQEQIGTQLGICSARVWQLSNKGKRAEKENLLSPLEQYFADDCDDLREIVFQIRKLERADRYRNAGSAVSG